MKNIFRSFIFFILLSFIGFGCKEKSFDNGLLWKISGKDLDKPSYILGTHHLTNISFLDSISGFYDILDGVDQIVGEVEVSPETLQEMQLKIMKAGQFAVGDGYKKMLSPEEYKRLDKGVRDLFKVGISNFEKMKPGLISSMCSQIIYSMVDSTFNPATHESIDFYLQRIAREAGKPTIGLETADDQIVAIYESESLKRQAENLICGLENVELSKEAIILLNQYYKERSLSKIYALSFNNEKDPCPPSERQIKALNEDRNNKWLKKLPLIMKEKSSLVAVGVLHLTGKEGLLYQLYGMGYDVELVE